MRMLSLGAGALALTVLAFSAHAGLPGLTPATAEQCATDAVAVSVDGFTRTDSTPGTLLREKMAGLHSRLSADAAAVPKGGWSVQLTAAERAAIGDVAVPGPRAQERRVQVGVGKALGFDVDLSSALAKGASEIAKGGVRDTGDGFTWTTTLKSDGAHALRVMFADMDLPDGAELYVYNQRGEAFGPYGGRGMDGTGELVSNTVTGDTVFVQLRAKGIDPSDSDRLRFRIAELGHIGPKFELARRVNPDIASDKAFCSYNVSCVINGECASGLASIESVRDAVAHMLYRSGGSYYICTGGLINNTANDGRNLFLTANHCISSERSADSLETFFDFRATSCSDTGVCDLTYTQMRSQFPTTLGALLLAADSAGDYSLMELDQTPGGTRHYLGYSTAVVANTNGVELYRISHPSGAPQAWSRQRVDAASFTCTTLPRGRFIYSQDTGVGATEGGSSGSPVVNGSGQIVGQLYGACGSNLDDECDTEGNRTVDGAMASYYADIAQYLNPQGGGGGTAVHVSNITLSAAPSGRNKFVGIANVTVVNASGAAVSGATVSGQFTFGNKKQNGSATTSSSGVATVQSGAQNTQNFTFCVTDITGTGISYSAGANTETCDSR
jgi:V8-like Glu-specific endopeptidase